MSSPHLPREITDYVVDLLRNEPEALKRCCLVSQSWVPRARRHLFDEVKFGTRRDLEAWIRAFPDPSHSPAHYVRSLLVGYVGGVTAEAIRWDWWFRFFSNVVRLKVLGDNFLLPSPSQVFKIVCSLPRLEDLTITCSEIAGRDHKHTFQPLTSPPLTGTLSVFLSRGMGQTMRALLDLPNGVHFRRFICAGHLEEDLEWIMALVKACSDTLEYIDMRCYLPPLQRSWRGSVDLSGATKLQEIAFRPSDNYVEWVTSVLKTITPEHTNLRRISISVRFLSAPVHSHFDEETYAQWVNLDRVLVQLWYSHSVIMKFMYITRRSDARKTVREFIGSLLPEMTREGAIRLVNIEDVVSIMPPRRRRLFGP